METFLVMLYSPGGTYLTTLETSDRETAYLSAQVFSAKIQAQSKFGNPPRIAIVHVPADAEYEGRLAHLVHR